MKLLFVFCFCFVGLLCANDSYAQRTMISVKAQNLTVKEVLSQIEAQSDFSFFYNDHHIDVDRRVSVVTEQSNIFTLLNEVFKNTNVKYAVRNKKIILSTQIVDAPAVKQTVQIKGKVTDMFGDPVIGATVMEDGATEWYDYRPGWEFHIEYSICQCDDYGFLRRLYVSDREGTIRQKSVGHSERGYQDTGRNRCRRFRYAEESQPDRFGIYGKCRGFTVTSGF